MQILLTYRHTWREAQCCHYVIHTRAAGMTGHIEGPIGSPVGFEFGTYPAELTGLLGGTAGRDAYASADNI